MMTHIMDTHLLGDVQFDVHDHVLGGLYIEPCIDGPGCSRPPHTHTQCESQAHNCPHTLPRVLAHTHTHTYTHTQYTHTHTLFHVCRQVSDAIPVPGFLDTLGPTVRAVQDQPPPPQLSQLPSPSDVFQAASGLLPFDALGGCVLLVCDCV